MNQRTRIVMASAAAVLIGGCAYLLFGWSAPSTSFIGRHYASLIPAPGESSTFSAYLATKDNEEVTLRSIRLLPLKGYRLPVLRHVKLLRVSSTRPAGFLADYGWPIRQPDGVPFHLAPLRGSSVETGRPRKGGPGYSEIVYNIAGEPNATIVADAGVAVTFSVNGSTETSDIDDGAIACYQKRFHGKPKLTYCTSKRLGAVSRRIRKHG